MHFFRFEEAWLQRDDCALVVEVGWAKDVLGTPSFRVCEKIKATRVKLLKWKHSLHSVQHEIKVVRDQMQILFQQPFDERGRNGRLVVLFIASCNHFLVKRKLIGSNGLKQPGYEYEIFSSEGFQSS